MKQDFLLFANLPKGDTRDQPFTEKRKDSSRGPYGNTPLGIIRQPESSGAMSPILAGVDFARLLLCVDVVCSSRVQCMLTKLGSFFIFVSIV